MRILISIITTILNCKIKVKSDKALIKAFSKTHKIFDENHVILNNLSDEIKINQNSVFLSANMIITEKTIFVLNVIFQIIQLVAVNSFLISIKHM